MNRVEWIRPVRRSVVLLVLVAAALVAGLATLTEQARPSEKARGERWDGKWDTNWGNLRIYQDNREVIAKWECNCPDGQPAQIDATVHVAGGDEGATNQAMEGKWRCGGGGGGGGFAIVVKDFSEKKRFKGYFWPKQAEGDKQRWVGDKE